MPGCQSWLFDRDDCDINPELITKPSLCICCKKNDDPSEEILCFLSRFGQIGAKYFHCNEFACCA